MTEVKSTKVQHEDFKQSALDKFSETIEQTIEDLDTYFDSLPDSKDDTTNE